MDEIKVEQNNPAPAYESNWASIFSLPDRWVTKALDVSVQSHSSGTFPAPILNQALENIDVVIPQVLQHERSKQKRQITCGNTKFGESSIFSEDFFIACLKSQLEGVEQNLEISRNVNKTDYISGDDIKKVINDDRYR